MFGHNYKNEGRFNL